ncbi:VOC family protein [Brevundimonas sp.]|uniref:VOC family protein n=1 Tax=Brevundimonas sp. TaxID=1871086 RepID=UPI002D3D8DC4|nr:VOC family protein [Brevundimonas sp.]HYC96866.1 VOC family protein [Brevundimonas sp.]
MFHLSLPVTDLAACEHFYREAFAATVQPLRAGVSNIHVFGAQLTLHERTDSALTGHARAEMHFGEVVPVASWMAMRTRLVEVGAPLIRCSEPSEGRRGKLVVQDPSGNLVEINSAD